jgi:hypothetical protein
VSDLDLPSMAVGFALSLVVFLGLSIVRKTLGFMIKLGLMLLIVALIAGAYMHWLERVR